MGDLAEQLGVLEEFDPLARIRNVIRDRAEALEDWAGWPMPLEGENLVIEPSYRFAKALGPKEEPKLPAEVTVRNSFWSTRWRRIVVVYERDGRVKYWPERGCGHVDQELRTMGCSAAWGIEQERNALKTLGELLRHHTFKMYLLSGMFLETSKRSGVTYLFRKLRPTIAIRSEGDRLRVLCALCMHPIAYYEDSWAGAMCPTDDVIAHLMLMRADEPMFWRRCSQHAPNRPQAGL